MAQYAEHGFRYQFAFVGTDAFPLEKIAQRGIGRMFQRQEGTQCLDNEFQAVFGK